MNIDLNKLFNEYKRINNIYESDDQKVFINNWSSFISWLKQQISLNYTY